MRLFIAVEIPEDIKAALLSAQKKIAETEHTNARLTFVKDFHFTLKFLGDVDDDTIKKIKELLDDVSFDAFDITLDSTGVFPDENDIRVVWVGVEPHSQIIALQQKIEKSLIGLFPKDDRFHPHLTLARVKIVKNKKKFAEQLKNLKIEKKSFFIKGFSLIRSALTPNGPDYETVYSFSF